MDGTGILNAQFRASRPGVLLTCSLVGQNSPRPAQPVFDVTQDCKFVL